MSAQLSHEERAVLRAMLGLGDTAGDIIDNATVVLLDLKKHPIGQVQRCTRNVCRVVRVRVLRDDIPKWRYVWPRKRDIVEWVDDKCAANAGGGHDFSTLEDSRPY